MRSHSPAIIANATLDGTEVSTGPTDLVVGDGDGVGLGLRNPILPGFNPDPSIIRVEGDYFLTTSTFEYFPGLPIYHSRDLVNWTLIGHVLTRASQLDLRTVPPGGGIFAPTLRYWKGRYYVTVCAVHSRTWGEDEDLRCWPRGFYVWTDNIWDQDSWSEPTYYDVLGIDQDLFFDDYDQVYLSIAKPIHDASVHHTGFDAGVYTAPIDLASGRTLEPLKLMRYSTVGNGCCEGPHIFKRGRYYYLITAEGGTEIEHQEWVCRSTAGPMGPWEVGPVGTVNPMVYNGDHPQIRQTGHMDIVEGTQGQWWAVVLAVRPVWEGSVGEKDVGPRLSQLGRETFLAPICWEDDWPIINNRRAITINAPTEGVMADLPRTPQVFEEASDFAPGMDLSKSGWYRLRTPVTAHDHSLTDRPGSLTLYGGPYHIRVDESPTLFLRKQTSFEGVWSVRLDYPELEIGHEAGTAVWWSKWAFASIGLRGREGGVGRDLVFRFPNRVGNEFQDTIISDINDGPIEFQIQAYPTEYHFAIRSAVDEEFKPVGVISSQVLVRTRPFDSLFTGTHFAIFAMGARQQGSLRPAHFDRVRWRGVRQGGK